MSLARSISATLLLIAALNAHAADRLSAGCNVNIQPLQFGNYDGSETQALRSSSSVTIRCQAATQLNVSFGPSGNSGSISDRQMAHVARDHRLAYNIFRDSAYSRVWGTVASGQSYALVASEKVTVDIPIFASIPAGQEVPEGQYHDTLTVTIEP